MNSQSWLRQETAARGPVQEGKKPKTDKLSDRSKMENCVEICIRDTWWNSDKNLKEGSQINVQRKLSKC